MYLFPPAEIEAIIARPEGLRLLAEVLDTASPVTQICPPRCRVCRQPTHFTDPALSNLQRQLILLRYAARRPSRVSTPPDSTSSTPPGATS